MGSVSLCPCFQISVLYDIFHRFVHPGVTDKGNYTMFEMVRPLVPVNGPPPMYGPPMDPFRPPPMMERPMVECYFHFVFRSVEFDSTVETLLTGHCGTEI